MTRPIPTGGWALRWVLAFAFVAAVLVGTVAVAVAVV